MPTVIPTPERHELYSAVSKGKIAKVLEFIKKYPDLARGPVLGEVDGKTWLQVAASHGRVEACQLLIEYGADVNAIEIQGGNTSTALMEAVNNDHLAVVQLLLDHGAKTNEEWIVISAIANEHKHSLELVKLLEAHGANLQHVITKNTLSGKPLNALSTAVQWGRKKVVDYLRSKGCVMPEESVGATAKKPGTTAGIAKPSRPATFADEMIAFCEQDFGPVDPQALIEIVASTDPAITLHVVRPDKKRQHITVFTTGMSDKAMKVPKDGKEFRFAELFIQLPAFWPLDKAHLEQHPNSFWPFEWLRKIAAYPHANKTWLGGPATIIANDDPPEPLAPKLKFTSLLALAEKQFTRTNGDLIRLYRLLPLYTEERDLEIREGIGALMNALDDNSIPFVVDLKRKNVGKG